MGLVSGVLDGPEEILDLSGLILQDLQELSGVLILLVVRDHQSVRPDLQVDGLRLQGALVDDRRVLDDGHDLLVDVFCHIHSSYLLLYFAMKLDTFSREVNTLQHSALGGKSVCLR